MKKIKATLKRGEKIIANVVNETYMISIGAWMLPANVVSVPKQLEYLVSNKTPFLATKERINTESLISFDRVWNPDAEIVSSVEETQIITCTNLMFRRWLDLDCGGEMWPVNNELYEPIKRIYPYWKAAKGENNSQCFYFSEGEGHPMKGKLMGVTPPFLTLSDKEYLKKLSDFSFFC